MLSENEGPLDSAACLKKTRQFGQRWFVLVRPGCCRRVAGRGGGRKKRRAEDGVRRGHTEGQRIGPCWVGSCLPGDYHIVPHFLVANEYSVNYRSTHLLGLEPMSNEGVA